MEAQARNEHCTFDDYIRVTTRGNVHVEARIALQIEKVLSTVVSNGLRASHRIHTNSDRRTLSKYHTHIHAYIPTSRYMGLKNIHGSGNVIAAAAGRRS